MKIFIYVLCLAQLLTRHKKISPKGRCKQRANYAVLWRMSTWLAKNKCANKVIKDSLLLWMYRFYHTKYNHDRVIPILIDSQSQRYIFSYCCYCSIQSEQLFPLKLGPRTNLWEWDGGRRCRVSERCGTRHGWWTCGTVPSRRDSPGHRSEPQCSSRSGTRPPQAWRALDGLRSPQPTDPAETKCFWISEGLPLPNQLVDNFARTAKNWNL